MSKIFWKSLLVSPAILGAALAVSSTAIAAETAAKLETLDTATAEVTEILAGAGISETEIPQEIAQAQPEAPSAEDDSQLLQQVEQYGTEGLSDSQGQVTSVNELRDVEPTAWAYEALRSLVERYGCIVGYPDRTFRGNRALTRWEFAAGLNACMNVMERLIQENVAVLREDIEKLKRLMEEFQAELAALGARVDNLESRVSFLEDHQFSTTTKLTGEVIFATSGLYAGNEASNQQVFQDRVRLTLNTSFSGEDRLVTRLAAGNSELFKLRNQQDNIYFNGDNLTLGELADLGLSIPTSVINDDRSVDIFISSRQDAQNPLTGQTWQNTQTGNDVTIDWLAYYAPIQFSDDFRLNTYVAAWGGQWYDFVPTLNPYFEDYDGGNGSLSNFAQRSSIYYIGGGTGAGLSLQLGFLEGILGPTSLSLGYLAGSTAGNPDQGFGLFNGNYTALAQLNFNLFNFVNMGFTYSNSYFRPESPIFGQGALNGAGLVGTSLANLSGDNLNSLDSLDEIYAVSRVRTFDNGNLTYQQTEGVYATAADLIVFDIPTKTLNSYGLEATMNITDWLTFSAYGNYSSVILNGQDSGEIWSYGGGFAFPDFGKEGNVLGIFAGVQPYLGGVSLRATNALGDFYSVPVSTKNPVSVEVFYKYQVTDNISLTPGILWISNPSQLADNNNDAVIGTLRGTFTF